MAELAKDYFWNDTPPETETRGYTGPGFWDWECTTEESRARARVELWEGRVRGEPGAVDLPGRALRSH